MIYLTVNYVYWDMLNTDEWIMFNSWSFNTFESCGFTKKKICQLFVDTVFKLFVGDINQLFVDSFKVWRLRKIAQINYRLSVTSKTMFQLFVYNLQRGLFGTSLRNFSGGAKNSFLHFCETSWKSHFCVRITIKSRLLFSKIAHVSETLKRKGFPTDFQ